MGGYRMLRIVSDEPGVRLELETVAPDEATDAGAIVSVRFSSTGIAGAAGSAREPFVVARASLQKIRLQARREEDGAELAMTCTLTTARGRFVRERELRFRVLNLDTVAEATDFAHRVGAVTGFVRVTVRGVGNSGLDVELGPPQDAGGLSPFRDVPEEQVEARSDGPADYHARFQEPERQIEPFAPWAIPAQMAGYVRVALWRPGHRVELRTWRWVTPAEEAALAGDWGLKRFFVELFSWKRAWMVRLRVVVDWDERRVSVESEKGVQRVPFGRVRSLRLADHDDKTVIATRTPDGSVVLAGVPCEHRSEMLTAGRMLAPLALDLARAMDVKFDYDAAFAELFERGGGAEAGSATVD